MRHIEPLAPERCPSCGAIRSFHVDGGAVRCARCAYVHRAEAADEEFTDAELEALFGDPVEAEGAAVAAVDPALQRRRESYVPSYILRHKDRSEIDAGFGGSPTEVRQL